MGPLVAAILVLAAVLVAVMMAVLWLTIRGHHHRMCKQEGSDV